jgi:hypothetical protein
MPLLAVFGVAIIEIWFAVPTGLALGLPAPVIWIMTVAGAIVSVSLVASTGDALRTWLVRRRGKEWPATTGRIYGIWVRYGVPGWGLVSPLFMSPPMGTAVALMLGAPKRRLLGWMFAGVVLWVTILVVAGIVGIGLIHGIH